MIQFGHRIVLTEKCNMSCPHCFNAKVREDRTMDVDILLRFFKENCFELDHSVLKIMGGEPTIHPRIVDVIRESCKCYLGSTLYTNGTTMKDIASEPVLVKHNFGGKLQYTINGFTFKIDDFLEYREFVKFVDLHFVIPINNPEKILTKIEKCMELAPKVSFIVSPNTQLNLLNDEKVLEEYRKVWIESTTYILPKLRFAGIPYQYDHRLPMCFFTQEMIDTLHSHDLGTMHKELTTCCGDEYMGLIGYDYEVSYCNQTRIKLGSLLKEDGSPKSVSELNDMIRVGTMQKVEQITELSDKCKTCHALPLCKVGCYYNTLVKDND